MAKGDNLRQEVRITKALYGVKYKDMAEQINLPAKSFASWLNGQYNFSDERASALKEVLKNIAGNAN